MTKQCSSCGGCCGGTKATGCLYGGNVATINSRVQIDAHVTSQDLLNDLRKVTLRPEFDQITVSELIGVLFMLLLEMDRRNK